MESCKACEAMQELEPHFDAIFDFIEENNLPPKLIDELAWLRIRLHTDVDSESDL